MIYEETDIIALKGSTREWEMDLKLVSWLTFCSLFQTHHVLQYSGLNRNKNVIGSMEELGLCFDVRMLCLNSLGSLSETSIRSEELARLQTNTGATASTYRVNDTLHKGMIGLYSEYITLRSFFLNICYQEK